MKRFEITDGLGVRLLQDAGIEVAIVTGRESLAVRMRAEELRVAECHQDDGANKLPIVRELLQRLGVGWDAGGVPLRRPRRPAGAAARGPPGGGGERRARGAGGGSLGDAAAGRGRGGAGVRRGAAARAGRWEERVAAYLAERDEEDA